MKNKIILAILILSIIALFFSGCGGENFVTPPTSTPVVELVKPLDDYENNISQRFGNYLGYYGGKYYNGFHSGEDIAVVAGTPVYAITSGWVANKISESDLGALGHIIVLKHNKGPFKIPGRNEEIHGQSYHYPLEEVDTIYSVYVHVKPVDGLSKDDWVETGKKIAEIADISAAGLGAHLHFEIRHPDQKPSGNWTMAGDFSNWSQFTDGTYNGYYKNLQEMVDAGFRHPSDFLGLASPTNTYTITASAGSHGSISPSGDITVNQGSNKSFTITPVIGYSIDDVLVDGSSVGAVSSYTFTNVIEDHTISATFTLGTVTGPVHNISKDTYYDTIQAALDDADNNNTIEVADGTYDESITFPSGKVIILQSVNGASSTIIRGDDGSSTVTLDGSLEGITLEGFTITHADGLIGRGIYIAGGSLIINNCIISGNSAGTWGGGIYNTGTLTITGSTISGNSANDCGGGIGNWGTLTITGSTISNNTAECGGGIHNVEPNGNLAINNCIISGNSAGHVGGIYNLGTLTITGSTISGNSSGTWGGGIYNTGTLTITGSTISGNSANDCGGGICNWSMSASLIIIGSTISNNTAYDNGGGIDNGYGSSLAIKGSIISNNTAYSSGGAISTCGYYNLTISGSAISTNTAVEGGGIYIIPTSGTIIIGGENPAKKNNICGNYKSGYDPSLDQQIRDRSGSLYETYKNTNYISVYCE